MNDLTEVFRVILKNPHLTLHPETAARDVPHWDSLNHVRIIVAVEKRFQIRFSMKEVLALKNVGDLLAAVQAKAKPTGSRV